VWSRHAISYRVASSVAMSVLSRMSTTVEARNIARAAGYGYDEDTDDTRRVQSHSHPVHTALRMAESKRQRSDMWSPRWGKDKRVIAMTGVGTKAVHSPSLSLVERASACRSPQGRTNAVDGPPNGYMPSEACVRVWRGRASVGRPTQRGPGVETRVRSPLGTDRGGTRNPTQARAAPCAHPSPHASPRSRRRRRDHLAHSAFAYPTWLR